MSHSDPKLDFVSHSPMTAVITQGAGSSSSLPDPESRATDDLAEKVEVTAKHTASKSCEISTDSIHGGSIKPTYDHTRRKLKPRHLQLIGIGGTIGTALYVQIGANLRTSGPASLFLGFSIW